MNITQLAKILADYPLFRNMGESDLTPLLLNHKFINVRHHGTLYQAGSPAESFSIVLTGAFKLVRSTPRGDDSIVYFATPGEVIGGLVMLKENGSFPVSAVALGVSTVLTMPRATYVSSWASNAAMQAKINATLYTRMSTLQEDKANAKLSLQQRVATLLLSLLDKHPETDASFLPIPLTRQEIADSVGSSVESVIRCMSELSQKGLIQTEDKKIEILRADKIVELLKN